MKKTAYATIKGFEVMRMIRKRQCITLLPGITGEVRFVAKLFGISSPDGHPPPGNSHTHNSQMPNATVPGDEQAIGARLQPATDKMHSAGSNGISFQIEYEW